MSKRKNAFIKSFPTIDAHFWEQWMEPPGCTVASLLRLLVWLLMSDANPWVKCNI